MSSSTNLIPNNRNKSAATSVKGKQQQVVRRNIPATRSSKQKRQSNPAPGWRSQNAPMIRQFVSNYPPHTYTSFTREGVHGLNVKGRFYLDDVTAMSDANKSGTSSTRVINTKYLHPDMVGGNLAMFSKGFTKYRFRKLRLMFVSQASSSVFGQVHLLYVDDPTIDISVLTDRQIKILMDSSPCHWSGQAWSKPEDANILCNVGKDDLCYIMKDKIDITEVYQGKFYIAYTGLSPAHPMIGQVEVDFECELISDIVTPSAALAYSANDDTKKYIKMLAGNANDPVQLGIEGINTLGRGIYSLFVDSEVPVEGSPNLNKLLTKGSEYFFARLEEPGGSVYNSNLYPSVTSLVSNNGNTGEGSNTVKYLTNFLDLAGYPLVGKVVKLIGNGLSSLLGTPESPSALALNVCVKASEYKRPVIRTDTSSDKGTAVLTTVSQRVSTPFRLESPIGTPGTPMENESHRGTGQWYNRDQY